MKSKYTLPIVSAIVIFITILLFCIGIPDGKLPIDYVALLFILVTEGVFFGVMFLVGHLETLTRLAVVPIISIYAAVGLLISLFLKGLFVLNISLFVTVHIVLLAITAVFLLIANKITFASSSEDKRISSQRAVIDECKLKAKILYEDDRFTDYRLKLEKVYDSIRYSDHVSDIKSSEILEVLNKIYERKVDTDIDMECDKAIRLINERNVIVKSMKRGGF